MLAAYAARFDADDPVSALEVGERPEPVAPEGWVTVDVKASALNHHDLWSLKGVGLAEAEPADDPRLRRGRVDPDGNEVVVHAVISDPAWKRRRDARPEAVAAERAVPRDAGRRRSSYRRATSYRSRLG